MAARAPDAGPTSPRAVNVGHSQLLDAPLQREALAPGGEAASLLEARRKFSSALESSVLDYLHFGPQQLEDCVRTLHTLFDNIVQHPGDAKFRRIKASNKAYLRHVVGVNHTEGLMLQAGWRSKARRRPGAARPARAASPAVGPWRRADAGATVAAAMQVVDLEKSWVWEHEPSSHEFRVLVEVTEVLAKAQATLHAKAERKRKEEEERKSKHAAERERIRLALEDDRRQRLLTAELTAARPHAAPAPDAGAAADAPDG
ncbi:hypothetical protein HT031_004205 [Scenedesmus sp. PABB004]|nr:hypothetical protein HT031_004205 [Scenedesmus sp. PABB004]